jgi:hypothetical protein
MKNSKNVASLEGHSQSINSKPIKHQPQLQANRKYKRVLFIAKIM